MGTCNFWGAGPFGYITCVIEYEEDVYKEMMPDEDGYTDDDRWRAFEEDSTNQYWEMGDEAKDAVEDLNDTLIFHRFEVAGGYYTGMEIRFKQGYYTGPEAPHDPDDWAELAEIWDDHEGYYTCDRPSHLRRARRLYEEECDRIAEWMDTTARELGFSPMGCVARFDNGEAWYARTDSLPVLDHDIGMDIGFGDHDREVTDWERDNLFAPLWACLETPFQTPFTEM